MNDIGVMICNYNGKDWTISCIESLKKQSIDRFDIHVVDNASTDGSIEAIRKNFSDEVEVLINEENLGGAGGFDRGLRYGIKKGYKYVVLLDNDIRLDKELIKNMHEYMENHSDVGIVGSKVMIMDEPEHIQDFGCRLDFNTFREYQNYHFLLENETPEEYDCDYVPTCAVMVRTAFLEKTGGMPAENFIYYDDIELSYQMREHGYRVVALGSAKVWHKGGFRKAIINTFPRYYFLRNRLHFFSKYINEGQIDKYIDEILGQVYGQLSGFYMKNSMELFQTVDFAFHDYLRGIRGKALEGRILPIEVKKTPFEEVISNEKDVMIYMMDNNNSENPDDIFYVLYYLLGILQKNSKREKVYISLEMCNYSEKDFVISWERIMSRTVPDFEIPKMIIENSTTNFSGIQLYLCEHIKNADKNILPAIWVDRFANCIRTIRDFRYITAYAENESFFHEIYKPLMKDAINRIRNKTNTINIF